MVRNAQRGSPSLPQACTERAMLRKATDRVELRCGIDAYLSTHLNCEQDSAVRHAVDFSGTSSQRGMQTLKVVALPMDSTCTLPPWAKAICFTINSPRPLAGVLLAGCAEQRFIGSKISSIDSQAIGGPWLATSSINSESSQLTVTMVALSGKPYVTALDTKLRSNCCKRFPSQ